MTDKYTGFSNLTSQAERWVTLAAFGVLAETPKAIFCNAAGTIILEGNDGVQATFSVAAGQTLDMRPKKIVAGGTLTVAQIILLLD